MILGSHNSWSYLPAKKWWMAPFSFMARCQNESVIGQYFWYNVRCFDLRVKFKGDNLIIAHGKMEYNYSKEDLFADLLFMNTREDCAIRLIHEVRTSKEYTSESINKFVDFCIEVQCRFPKIKFWCGENLYNHCADYEFAYKPDCEEKYASVCAPKWIDDWFPLIYAKLNNKKIKQLGTDKEILLIDFVNL